MTPVQSHARRSAQNAIARSPFAEQFVQRDRPALANLSAGRGDILVDLPTRFAILIDRSLNALRRVGVQDANEVAQRASSPNGQTDDDFGERLTRQPPRLESCVRFVGQGNGLPFLRQSHAHRSARSRWYSPYLYPLISTTILRPAFVIVTSSSPRRPRLLSMSVGMRSTVPRPLRESFR